MEYEGQICRGPMEKGSYMLPVTVGCPYNKCKFCNLFKHLKFRVIPKDLIIKELKRVKNLKGMPKKVFLGDGSAFTLNYEKLYEIIKLIKKYLPSVENINCDATISSVKNKSDDELKSLKDLGLSTLYIGIESGLDDVLQFMDKDHNTNDAINQIERLKKVRIDFGAHIMTGIAGCGRSFENAKATADFLFFPRKVYFFDIE